MNKPTIQLQDIQESAEKIRDIMQSIINACQSGQPIDHYARAKMAGGSLAGDVASLGIMIVAREYQEGE